MSKFFIVFLCYVNWPTFACYSWKSFKYCTTRYVVLIQKSLISSIDRVDRRWLLQNNGFHNIYFFESRVNSENIKWKFILYKGMLEFSLLELYKRDLGFMTSSFKIIWLCWCLVYLFKGVICFFRSLLVNLLCNLAANATIKQTL